MALDPSLYSYILQEETYPDKAIIVKEGAPGDWVYLILEGRASVKKKTPNGQLKVASLKEGTVFGELIFLQIAKGPRTASIVADGSVTVGLLDMERLYKEFRSISPLLKVLISTIAERLQDATDHLVSISQQ